MQDTLPEGRGEEGSVYSSATSFVRLNQEEMNYQDKQEDWRNSEMDMKFWQKKFTEKTG